MSESFSAGNGLLSRRKLLQLGGGITAGGIIASVMANQPWMTRPGQAASVYGTPSSHAKLNREMVNSHTYGPEAGSSSTPLQALNGTITPNSLHFERHHSGIPDIDPEHHRLTIFGMVKQPKTFRYDSLLRYPMQTRILFLECSGNSYINTLPKARDMTAGELNGLVSCSEWTGIPLHHLFDEVGINQAAKWVIAEGADASGNNRSVPLDLALNDAMIATHQNGEPIRGAQGYPFRLLMPGCEGNLSIKWLSSLKLVDKPAHTREETSTYTDLMADGSAARFTLRMEVKSVITSPSGKMTLPEKGVYEVTGLAWSGGGKISMVEVSADGGRTWAEAELQSESAPLRPVRFRIPWRWSGQSAVLQSRAHDVDGNIQPSREQALKGQAAIPNYHYNGIQSWRINNQGRVENVYA